MTTALAIARVRAGWRERLRAWLLWHHPFGHRLRFYYDRVQGFHDKMTRPEFEAAWRDDLHSKHREPACDHGIGCCYVERRLPVILSVNRCVLKRAGMVRHCCDFDRRTADPRVDHFAQQIERWNTYIGR